MGEANIPQKYHNLHFLGAIDHHPGKTLRVYNVRTSRETLVKNFQKKPDGRWERRGTTLCVKAEELPTLIRTLLKAHEAHQRADEKRKP